MNRCPSSLSLGLLLSVWLATPAAAEQTGLPKPPPPSAPSQARTAKPVASPKMKGGWQVDFHGGFLPGSTTTAGTGSLPPAGEGFTTSGNLPSRFVDSFYFGDGAALLRTVAASLPNQGVSQMVPLDGILTTGAERKGGPAYGVRIGHSVTSHALAEFSFDIGRSRATLSSGTLAAIEASRASFKTVFDQLLINQAANTVTTSVATIHDNSGSQMSMIGSVNINAGTFGRITPYVTLGGGLLLARGTPTSFTMDGKYAFQVNVPGNPANGMTIGDTNSLTVTYGVADSFIKLFGGGVQTRLSGRSGVRADVRVYLAGLTIDVVTNNTTPSGSANGVLTRGLNGPQIQFSAGNQPSTLENGGRRITTFEGSGKIVTVTFGYYLRF